jgi:hypothetical protein
LPPPAGGDFGRASSVIDMPTYPSLVIRAP